MVDQDNAIKFIKHISFIVSKAKSHKFNDKAVVLCGGPRGNPVGVPPSELRSKRSEQ